MAGIETLEGIKLTHDSYWSMSGHISNIAESVALLKAKNTALTVRRNAKINTYADINENANIGLSIDMSNGIPLDMAGSMSNFCIQKELKNCLDIIGSMKSSFITKAFKDYRNAQIERLLQDKNIRNAVKELTL